MEESNYSDEDTWEELARPGFELNLNRAGTIYFTEVCFTLKQFFIFHV